ncbi:MAG TPA: glycosyltransferase family 2 protein [Burkholderiaceae bacterium]|nr:glycosyltransferase family 2 protein [Burkholderiaceae bacterium]
MSTPGSPAPRFLGRLDAWLRAFNRRRLARRRAAQHHEAERAWFSDTDPASPMVARALQARLAALTQPRHLSLLQLPPHAQTGPTAEQPLLYPHWAWVAAGAEPGEREVDRFRRGLREARGDFVVIVPGDSRLAPHALLLVAEVIKRFPAAAVIYGDQDCIDANGRRHGPLLRCDWNAELLRATNYLSGGVVAARRDALLAAGGLGDEPPDAAWWDLLLKLTEQAPRDAVVHIPHVLSHQRADAPPLRWAPIEPASAADAAVVQAHLDRCGVQATARPSVEGGVRVVYAVPREAPLVSLIIPTRNGLRLLRQCISSIFERTTYPTYELVVVDNGSDDADTLRYLQQLAADPRVRVHRDDRPFNFSALNNAAARLCRGELLGLVNNDIEVISPGWLDEMAGLAARADVGAVGARLWYGQGRLQHAGVILGMGGVAGHLHRGLTREQGGYLGRARLTQEFSAVTAACMLLRRSVFDEVGGLDEQHLAVDFNDIDLCLRIREAGYRVVWTPHAELFHHESASRGTHLDAEQQSRQGREFACMRERWSRWLDNDPAYNPNASLKNNDFEFAIATQPRVSLSDTWFDAAVPARAGRSKGGG